MSDEPPFTPHEKLIIQGFKKMRDERPKGVLRWTTDKPTRPGWYWYREGEGPEIYWVFAAPFNGQVRMYAGHKDEGGIWIDSWRGDWAGPLEPPA